MTKKEGPRFLAYLNPEVGNETLLTLVEHHAKRRGAAVLAMSVLEELPWYARIGTGGTAAAHAAREETAARWLKREIKPLVSAGVPVKTQIAWGRPFEAIIHEALRRPTQLVVKTARSDGPLGGLLGSTAMHLLRKCPVPVWVVKPSPSSRLRTVMAAVDPATMPDKGDLNVAILQLASEIAEAERAVLHVFHGYSALEPHHVHHPIPDVEYQAYLRQVRENLDSALARLLAPFGIEPDGGRLHVLPGNPGSILPSLVSKIDVDLLVMGTLERAGVPGLLIGNTAERMLRAVDCSVLTIKPRGFVSPVGAAARS